MAIDCAYKVNEIKENSYITLHTMTKRLYFFPGLFFIIFSCIWSFRVVWGFGVEVLDWVFGVGFFC